MICFYEKYDAVFQDDLKIDILVTKKNCKKVNLGDQYLVALILNINFSSKWLTSCYNILSRKWLIIGCNIISRKWLFRYCNIFSGSYYNYNINLSRKWLTNCYNISSSRMWLNTCCNIFSRKWLVRCCNIFSWKFLVTWRMMSRKWHILHKVRVSRKWLTLLFSCSVVNILYYIWNFLYW